MYFPCLRTSNSPPNRISPTSAPNHGARFTRHMPECATKGRQLKFHGAPAHAGNPSAAAAASTIRRMEISMYFRAAQPCVRRASDVHPRRSRSTTCLRIVDVNWPSTIRESDSHRPHPSAEFASKVSFRMSNQPGPSRPDQLPPTPLLLAIAPDDNSRDPTSSMLAGVPVWQPAQLKLFLYSCLLRHPDHRTRPHQDRTEQSRILERLTFQARTGALPNRHDWKLGVTTCIGRRRHRLPLPASSTQATVPYQGQHHFPAHT